MKHHLLACTITIVGMGCNLVLGIESPRTQCASLAPGTPVGHQVPGDCRRIECDEFGHVREAFFDSDIPDDGNPCTVEKCSQGNAVFETLLTAPCVYNGPTNTENVGECHAGTQECVNGKPSGQCMGEVVPKLETCLEPGDEDCDGQTDEEGPGCDCVPKSTRPCYSGPAGTEDIGTCHAGVQTCRDDGHGYGPCENESTPKPDTCDLADADEDCNGIVACTGRSIVVKQFGSTDGPDILHALAVDAMGNVILAGVAAGEIDFGGKTAGAGSFVVKLDAQGSPIWVKSFTSGFISKMALATTPNGGVILAATTGIIANGAAPNVQFDEETISGGGSEIFAFVVHIDGATGLATWSRGTTGGLANVHSAVSDDAGNVFLLGDYKNDVGFAGQLLPATNSVFLLKLLPNGDFAWSKTLGKTVAANGTSIDTDAQGNVHAFGTFVEDITLDMSMVVSKGFADMFFVSYDTQGNPIKSIVIGGAGNERGLMQIAPSGVRWLAGTTNDTLDLGAGPLPHIDQDEAFLAAYETNGQHVFSESCTGMGNQQTQKIAIDSAGRTVIVGTFQGTMDCNGQTWTAESPTDVFVRSVDKDYSPRWFRQFHASGGTLVVRALATNAADGIWLGGTFSGSVDWKLKSTITTGDDIFLVLLAQ